MPSKVWMLHINRLDYIYSKDYDSVLLFKSEENAKAYMEEEANKHKMKIKERTWTNKAGFVTYVGHAKNEDIYTYKLGLVDVK